jgi:aminopeptidase-like protein
LLFIPGTIGSIAWLALNASRLQSIRHGLVLTGLGGPGPLVYKRSRRGDTVTDRAAAVALRDLGDASELRNFIPYGYDERQYCSPGINLPIGCLSRTPFNEYPEYHTSADNLEFVTGEQLQRSYKACHSIVTVLEQNRTYLNTNPMCEPQLGRRGLYAAMGGAGERRTREMAMLWVLNLSDGTNSLLDISERSGVSFETIIEAATRLAEHGLLRESHASPARNPEAMESTRGLG